jgi:putative transposase
MRDWKSLSHVRWDCKYHIVFVSKYRQETIYGQLRKKIGAIIRDLCQQKGIELLEGHAMSDLLWSRKNGHFLLSRPLV